MRRTSLLFVLGLAACGGSGKPAAAPPTPPTDAAVIEDDPEPDAGEDDGLELVSDRGRIDPDVATAKVAPHAAALDACYSEQLGRRRWLGGRPMAAPVCVPHAFQRTTTSSPSATVAEVYQQMAEAGVRSFAYPSAQADACFFFLRGGAAVKALAKELPNAHR